MAVKQAMSAATRPDRAGRAAAIFMAACLLLAWALIRAGAQPGDLSRIALLAPFEGRYREIGYDALYAARLAVQDFGHNQIELLAVDDGGDAASAADRARALAGDPLVRAVVALGYSATEETTQQALAGTGKPLLIVGGWGARPAHPGVFVLANRLLDAQVTVYARVEITQAASFDPPLVGGEAFALRQFARLRSSLEGVKAISSGAPPDAAFAERYAQTGLFVPPPGLLATLTYDAFGLTLNALEYPADRSLAETVSRMEYDGLNGAIRFEHGYWAGAPINSYSYDADCLADTADADRLCLAPAD